jgi:hypothetical protein
MLATTENRTYRTCDLHDSLGSFRPPSRQNKVLCCHGGSRYPFWSGPVDVQPPASYTETPTSLAHQASPSLLRYPAPTKWVVIQSRAQYVRRMIHPCFPAPQDSWSSLHFFGQVRRSSSVGRSNPNRSPRCAITSATIQILARTGPILTSTTARGPLPRVAAGQCRLSTPMALYGCGAACRCGATPWVPWPSASQRTHSWGVGTLLWQTRPT